MVLIDRRIFIITHIPYLFHRSRLLVLFFSSCFRIAHIHHTRLETRISHVLSRPLSSIRFPPWRSLTLPCVFNEPTDEHTMNINHQLDTFFLFPGSTKVSDFPLSIFLVTILEDTCLGRNTLNMNAAVQFTMHQAWERGTLAAMSRTRRTPSPLFQDPVVSQF